MFSVFICAKNVLSLSVTGRTFRGATLRNIMFCFAILVMKLIMLFRKLLKRKIMHKEVTKINARIIVDA